jgi:hypothetical protein
LACWTQSKAGGGTRRLAENKKPDVFHVGSRARAKFTAGSWELGWNFTHFQKEAKKKNTTNLLPKAMIL